LRPPPDTSQWLNRTLHASTPLFALSARA
jgi:hypothetical protein